MSKFLIVDDSATFRAVLSKLIRQTWPDAEIIQADNGSQAAVLNNTEKPDIILLDLNMPGSDGFETVRNIQTDYRKTNVKIIVLTGTEDESAEHILLGGVGVQGFLKKPVQAAALIAMIRKQLGEEEAGGDADLMG